MDCDNRKKEDEMNWKILPGCPLTPCFQKPDIAGISVWTREDELESSGTLCGTEGTIRQTVYTSGNVRLIPCFR